MSEKKETIINRTDDLTFYLEKNRFWDFLVKTKKYKDLYWSKEALLALTLTLISMTMFFLILFQVKTLKFSEFNTRELDIEAFLNIIRTTLSFIIGGVFGFLGFLVSGLAILAGMASNKILKNIVDSGKVHRLIRILFSFYFTGAILGVVQVFCIISYLTTYIHLQFSVVLFTVYYILTGYLFFFSFIYSIMLLGTCLRFFLLNYVYFQE